MPGPIIKQITATLINNNQGSGAIVFGLSEDGKVYKWQTGMWVIAT